MVLEAIKYQRGSLQVLDQLQLPHRTHFDSVDSAQDAWRAIREMRVRGAPAIAIVAALGLAVEVESLSPNSPEGLRLKEHIHEQLDYLITSRPTAVNLAGAAKTLKAVVNEAEPQQDAVKEAYLKAAEQMLVLDVQDNEAIGKYGAEWILQNQQTPGTPVSILTHCNTGSLATAGYGTALGVIRSVHAKGKLQHAFCTETRPYNQGSRLTSFELVHDAIPATLITDSMAAALLRLKGPAQNIAAIVIGADRVAANGDTANKIGSYALAIAARHHGVKFLVAAPRTTIDMSTPSGAHIKIEERPPGELTTVKGPKVTESGLDLDNPAVAVATAATGIDVWNPAFDVTPAELIDGIITEVGVAEKRYGAFALQKLMSEKASESVVNGHS